MCARGLMAPAACSRWDPRLGEEGRRGGSSICKHHYLLPFSKCLYKECFPREFADDVRSICILVRSVLPMLPVRLVLTAQQAHADTRGAASAIFSHVSGLTRGFCRFPSRHGGDKT